VTEEQEEALIGEDGRPRFGLYPRPLTRYNLKDFRPYGKKGPPSSARRFWMKYRLKQWQFLGLVNQDLIFGLAVVRLGYLCNLFAYLFERPNRQLFRWDLISPGGKAASFQGTSEKGEILFRKGETQILIRSRLSTIHLTGAIQKGLRVDLTFHREAEPLICLTRIGLKGFNYTHKEAGLPVHGTIAYQDLSLNIEAASAFGVLDYTLGLPGRETFWNWAAGGGRDKQGNRIGFNLVQGINETGFTENAFWVNGRLVKTDVADFRYDDLEPLKPWRIASNDGRVRLCFFPEGARSADIQGGLIISRFRQPFGRFEGTLTDGATLIELDKAAGFTEEHFAKW
jgi:hypothetical protein